jgi:hypothetical protein
MSEAAALAALAAQGAAEREPLRWHTLQALARRRGLLQGTARQRLEVRLAQRIAECAARLEAAAEAAPAAAPTPGPLAQLLAALPRETAEAAAATGPTPRPPELKALRQYRRSWQQLGAEQRLAQSLAYVPPNAGPLNSPGLVYRALQRMHASAPGYLQHFIAHAEGLMALEALTGSAEARPAKPRR